MERCKVYRSKIPFLTLTVWVIFFLLTSCSSYNNIGNKADTEQQIESKKSSHFEDYQNITIATGGFNVGQKATEEEIAGWHIEVSHGHNLPTGSGSAAQGEELYDEKCASCHGSFGEGVGRNPVLAGGEDTLSDVLRPEKTVGSYWPYASTLLDYTHRAMPFSNAQSLSWDETWSISAYVLYLNDIIVDEDFEFNAGSYHEISMPNQNGFIFKGNKPDTYNTRCMSNCKDALSLTVKTALLGYDSGAEDRLRKTTEVVEMSRGKDIYMNTCHVCHNTGLSGAPKITDAENWHTRLNQGIKQIYVHAIEGYQGLNGFMPAKGGNMQLSDEEVKAAVEFMLKDIKN